MICLNPICKNVFTPSRGGQEFCSKKCYKSHWQKTNRIVKDFGVAKCLVCGVEFKKRRGYESTCSDKHSKKYYNLKKSLKRQETRSKTIKICKNCGVPFSLKGMGNRGGCYCSKKCYVEQTIKNAAIKYKTNKIFREQTRKTNNRLSKKYRDDLKDFYIKNLLKTKHGIKNAPVAFIELTKSHLMLYRELKNQITKI